MRAQTLYIYIWFLFTVKWEIYMAELIRVLAYNPKPGKCKKFQGYFNFTFLASFFCKGSLYGFRCQVFALRNLTSLFYLPQAYFGLHGPLGNRMFDLVTQNRKDQKLTFEDLVIAKVSLEDNWMSSVIRKILSFNFWTCSFDWKIHYACLLL